MPPPPTPPHMNSVPPAVLNYRSPDGDNWGEVVNIARAQRRLLLVILGNICATILYAVVMMPAGGKGPGPHPALGLLVVIFVLIVMALQITCFALMLRAMRYTTVGIVFLCIGSVLSCIGLIILLVINQQATSRLQRAGLKVGLLGAKIEAGPPGV
jgi:hypothetical protein